AELPQALILFGLVGAHADQADVVRLEPAGAGAGERAVGPAGATPGGGARPSRGRLWLVAGVWLSMWASTQINPSGPGTVRATPVQVPPAQLWSPPITQGSRPRRRASATAAASWPQSLLTANCLRRSPAGGWRI